MKVSFMAVAMVLATAGARADLQVGDDYFQVLAELGQPQGEIHSGGYRLMTYERGRVELRDGRVVVCDIISEEMAAQKRELAAKQNAEAQKLAAEARAKRIADGTALRTARLADAAFMASPAASRVAYWQGFKKAYPEVPLGGEYTLALKELEQQYAADRVAQAQQQQIADLERRVTDAEQRARQAEQRSSYVFTDYTTAPAYVVGIPYWSYRPAAKPPFGCPPLPAKNYVSTQPVNSTWVASPFLINQGVSYSPGVSANYSGNGLSVTVRTR